MKAEAASVTSLGQVFKGNTEITSFNELQYFTGLTSITTEVFASSSIQSVTLPKDCLVIGNAVFWNCKNLNTVNGLERVSSIGLNAFLNTSLTKVKLANYSGIISNSAFRTCSKLVEVDLGSGVSQLDGEVFSSCSLLSTLIVRAITPPALVGTNFYGCPLTSIYVPDDSVDTYKSLWSSYASQIKPLSEYVES